MKRVAHLGASLLLLVIALWWVSVEDVLARLQSAQPVWLLLAFACLTLSTWSMARRWQRTAEALDLELRYFPALREYYLAQAMNALLPGGVVGDVSRAIRLRGKGDLKRAAQSVVAERVLGQVALLVILTLGMGFALAMPGAIAWPVATGWIFAVSVCVGGVVLAGFALAGPTAAFFRFCLGLLMRPAIAAHTFAAAGLLIFALYACARATGTDVPFEAVVTVLPLVLSAMLIPLSVAGWGWREGAAAALFPLFGASAEAGVTMGICYGGLALIAALPGVGFALSPVDKTTLERA